MKKKTMLVENKIILVLDLKLVMSNMKYIMLSDDYYSSSSVKKCFLQLLLKVWSVMPDVCMWFERLLNMLLMWTKKDIDLEVDLANGVLMLFLFLVLWLWTSECCVIRSDKYVGARLLRIRNIIVRLCNSRRSFILRILFDLQMWLMWSYLRSP